MYPNYSGNFEFPWIPVCILEYSAGNHVEIDGFVEGHDSIYARCLVRILIFQFCCWYSSEDSGIRMEMVKWEY